MIWVDTLKDKPLRIKDARGRCVTQLDPVSLTLLRQYDTVDGHTLRQVVAEESVRIQKKERVALLRSLGVGLLVVGLFLYAVLIEGDFFSAPLARTASLLYFGAIPWVIWYVLKRARFKHVAAAMLKYLCCPHCGYELRLLPADSTDGTTVCPECGCAWRLTETMAAVPTRAANGH